jgi:phenylacetate-CoA ligase
MKTPAYEGLFKHALFPAYETLAKRRDTAAHVREYERNQWLPQAALRALQLEKLNALLAHAWTQVPFLRAYWGDHGCRPGPLGDVSELQRFPLLTKGQITANYLAMTAVNWRGRTLSKTTGGSTGDPFRFEYTMEVYARRTAVMWRGYGWAGAGLGTRTAYLWGSAPPKPGWPGLKDKLYHGAFNRRFFDAFGLSDASIDGTIDAMLAYKPHAFVGYVAPAVLLARRMLVTGKRLSGLRGAITGAEALFESERKELEAAFGCPVFNTYGTREVMLLAAECPAHSGLHVNSDHLVLETVDAAGQGVGPGRSGAVAVTDLHNFGMPMVRYLNGDSATYAHRGCTCGRGLPLLETVDGRVLDLITTPDGRALLGEFFVYVMLEWPDVKKWQVVQTATDCVEFRLVVAAPWSQEEKAKLRSRIHAKSGQGMRVEVREVEKIDDAASGKRRLTISLPHAQKMGLV